MTKIDIDILIKEKIWNEKFQSKKKILKEITRNILKKIDWPKSIDHIEYSVTFASNKYIKNINQIHRNINKPTNVLSFPAQIIDLRNHNLIQNYDGYLMLGDIIFAHEIIQEEANLEDISFISHMYHLITHGILHLLGYNHENDTDAKIMESLEENILSDYSIKSPYN